MIDILLYSHHLPAWYCIDIVRINSLLVTCGSERVNKSCFAVLCWWELKQQVVIFGVSLVEIKILYLLLIELSRCLKHENMHLTYVKTTYVVMPYIISVSCDLNDTYFSCLSTCHTVDKCYVWITHPHLTK